MNPERLLQHFERISEAPDAIPRLRQFILDLAVQGQLVLQDPSDEPAVELLNRMQVEKDRLAKDRLRKRLRATPLIDASEAPCFLPTTWEWVRIGDLLLGDSQNGYSKKPDDDVNGIPILRISAGTVRKDGIVAEEEHKFIGGVQPPQQEQYQLQPGDLLACRFNGNRSFVGRLSLYLGYFGIKPIYPDKLIRLRLLSRFVLPKLVRCFAESSVVRGDVEGYCITTVGNWGISAANLKEVKIPLPPLAEQHRIIAKVDELMALCDQLDAAKTEREQSRDRLVAASQHRLNSPADTAETDPSNLPARQADTCRDHASFVFNHLPRLTTRPEHIKQLRQTILNLAVRGKLVPQDPNDEPAVELLKRIHAEKARLVKAGKINREKPLIPAGDSELAFGLKPGWQATKIGQILVELQTGPFGSSLHQSDYQKGGIPVINPASIKNERLVPIDGMAVGLETLERLATFKLRVGDIVMGRRGEMGRCAVVTELESGWLCGTESLILRLPECVFPRFFVTLIGSPFVREYLGGSAVGATMQNLNQSILLNLVIGLPPLAEQHRIVARVDELMALCDQLEVQLATTEADSRRLLEAVLHEALAPALEETI
jgi:type I restriction enzyme S subunit